MSPVAGGVPDSFVHLASAGEGALILRLGDEISPAMLERVLATLAALDARRPAGVLDVVPGYASVMVHFDPLRVTGPELRQQIALALWMTRALPGGALPAAAVAPAAAPLTIPVFYDPQVAPDLLPLAREKNLQVATLIKRHSAPTYRCHLLGFRPGFPFLGGLDPGLAAARLTTPRARVAAGSVGIGGRQTGIYPLAGAGGWRIIGRTPAVLFDPARDRPFLVVAGDQVRFVPIDGQEFVKLGGQLGAGPA